MSSILADQQEPKCGGRGKVAGSQPMHTTVHRSPNKLWGSNSIFSYGTIVYELTKFRALPFSHVFFLSIKTDPDCGFLHILPKNSDKISPTRNVNKQKPAVYKNTKDNNLHTMPARRGFH
jgi:hypothetical protein